MTSNRKIIAVVPAAGIGSRMQADKPKQYLPIHGQPILQHTLNVLLSYPHISQIVLAVAADDPYIAQLNLAQNPKITLVEGGETRADSVLNGLKAIQDAGTDVWVMVHDAAQFWPFRRRIPSSVRCLHNKLLTLKIVANSGWRRRHSFSVRIYYETR